MATKTESTSNDTETTTPSDSIELVTKAFDQSWEYTQGSWHDRWQDNYKLYNNQRIKYGYKGISDTFVPMTFGTIETLTSALFGTKPKWGYLPPSDKADQSTDSLNALVDQWWDKDQWSMKVINTGRGGLREGTAVDYFCWDKDHPHMINVPIRDFFIDPNAYELNESSTRYCGRRYITTIEELESFEIIDLEAMDKAKNVRTDDAAPIYKKKYQNLDKLKGTSIDDPIKGGSENQDQTTDKQEKDLLYGSTLNEPQKDQVEVIEYWTVDKTISIANRMIDIEDVENYFKTQARQMGEDFPQGILPFTAFRDYVDGSLFYAKGEVDFISDQQEDLNDFSNQMKDAVSTNLNQQKTLHPDYAHLQKEIQNIPGGVYVLPPDMLVPIPNGQIPAEAFNERQNIKSEIRETTASNEVVKGATDTSKGNQTATEINAQVSGSGQRLSLKVVQIENEYFYRMGKIVHRMAQLYVTEPMMVRVLSKNGVTWQKFDPKDFKGEYEPRVQLDISIQNKKQQQATDAANLLKAFLNDPNVNQQELTKLVLQRGFDLEPDEVQLLMAPQGQAGGASGAPTDPATLAAMAQMGGSSGAMPMPGAIPGQAPAPTGPPPKLPAESITFKDAVAAGAIDSAAAMLQQAGLPANDIQQQRPAPGQVIGGQVQQPQLPDPNQIPGDTQNMPDASPSATDIISHPQTGEPVMAGSLQ